MNCKQGVSGVLGGVNLAKHSQTVSCVCAKKRLTVWVNAARTTPLNTPTPPLKKNSCFPGGLQKNGFFCPHPLPALRLKFQRLFEFLNLISGGSQLDLKMLTWPNTNRALERQMTGTPRPISSTRSD